PRPPVPRSGARVPAGDRRAPAARALRPGDERLRLSRPSYLRPLTGDRSRSTGHGRVPRSGALSPRGRRHVPGNAARPDTDVSPPTAVASVAFLKARPSVGRAPRRTTDHGPHPHVPRHAGGR